MKASELIKELQDIIDEHGEDVKVFYDDADEGYLPIVNLTVWDNLSIGWHEQTGPAVVIG